jgi:hypothetical protein
VNDIYIIDIPSTASEIHVGQRSQDAQTTSVTMRRLLLVVLTVVSVATASPVYDSQVAFKINQEGLVSSFDDTGDDVTRWAHDGRDFIHRDGSTCKSKPPAGLVSSASLLVC